MGVACHIYSAAKEGPRGQGGRDKEFIESAENGIWCCQYHAALIDKKKGIDYPASTLFAWKRLAEARVRKQMSDIPSPLGWVESIEFLTPHARGFPEPKIVLSRNTLFTGGNERGKTALLEAAASICNSKYFERISSSYSIVEDEKVGVRIEAKITYSTVDTFSKEVHIVADNFVIKRRTGNAPCLLPPGDIEVIFISEDDARKRESEDDLRFLMRALNVDLSALRELIEIGQADFFDGKLHLRKEMKEDTIGNFYQRTDEDGNEFYELVLTRKRAGLDIDVSYNRLSTSEKGRLLIALSITKAREVAKQRLTLLIVESLAINFDEANFKKLLTALRVEDFQSLVTIPPIREKSIIDFCDGKNNLRDLDYLKDWTLQEL